MKYLGVRNGALLREYLDPDVPTHDLTRQTELSARMIAALENLNTW